MDKDRSLVVGLVALIDLGEAEMNQKPSSPILEMIRLPPHGFSVYFGHGSTSPALSTSNGRCNATADLARQQEAFHNSLQHDT